MSTQTEKKFVTAARPLAAQPTGPVKIRFTESAKGTFIELSVDYERAEVPDRRYYADYSDVIEGRSGLNFIFGRLIPGQSTLRTKVEISFPDKQFVRQLWQGSRAFHEMLNQEFAHHRLSPIDQLQDTDKVQSFRANNVFMAKMGDDAVIDFYYIAPPDIHFARFGKRSDIYLEPIIRIAASTALVFEFLEQCSPYAEKLRNITDTTEES